MDRSESLLYTPQRQSKTGILIEIVNAFQKSLRQFWPLLIFLFIKLKGTGFLFVLITVLLLLICVCCYGYLYYKNFLFYISEESGEFILEKGVFNKQQVAIKFSRIQQVNINQSFLQKLTDVFQVEIETAGSLKEEVKISAVSDRTAKLLRRYLITARNNEVENKFIEDADTLPEKNFEIKIPFINLLKIAVTSDYFKSLWLAILFLIAAYSKLKDIFFSNKETESKFFDYLLSLNLRNYMISLITAGLIVILIFNILKTIFIFYGYKIKVRENSFHFSYGLLNTREILFNVEKVQLVRIVTNFFQRKMNIKRVFISQASGNIEKDKKATIQLPGINEHDGNYILKLIYQVLPYGGKTIKPSFKRVLSGFYRFILFPVCSFIIATIFKSPWEKYLIFIPLYLVIVFALIYIGYKNSSLSVNESFIIKKSGIWDITTEIITPDKIQSVTTRQYLWHRKLNIGHVIISTAGGEITFKFGNFSVINDQVNIWLYNIESNNKNWM